MNFFYNTHFIFVCFFLLAVIKPFSLPNSNRYVGIFTLFLLVILFTSHFFYRKAYKKFFSQYFLVVFFILLFLIFNLLALSLNLTFFLLPQHILFFGFSSIAVWSAFFMSWVVFSENSHLKGQYLGWFLIFLLALIALWQIIDYPASTLITQYFVSADSIYNNSHSISSITRWHTIYGVIAAISILVALQNILFRDYSWFIKLIFIFLIILLAYTGVMGQSRNFLFTLSIGILIITMKYLFIKPKITLSMLSLCLLLVHILLLNNDSVGRKYNQIFPYLQEIKKGNLPKIKDFIPQINNHSLNGRADLWEQGYLLWKKSPWLGIGPGVYRSINYKDIEQRNLHNYYLQVLVDTGIIGFSFLMLLILLLLRQAYQSKNVMILFAILVSLIFDNYLDYSFAWVFMMSWLLFVSQSKMTYQHSVRA